MSIIFISALIALLKLPIGAMSGLVNRDTVDVLPGEYFVKTRLMNSNGTLKTTLSPGSSGGADYALGDESLSEALGLWMLYAYEKGDRELFDQSVQVLREYFWHDGWIAWKLSADGTPATTNALIDDLRIAEALYAAAGKWRDPSYYELADQIAQSIYQRQVVDGILSDFFDIERQWTHTGLTLSYINGVALSIMRNRLPAQAAPFEATISLLRDLPARNNFFPATYDIPNRVYTFHDEINLIDQLYIAFHRSQMGWPVTEFWSFVENEFYQRRALFGKYNLASGQPAAGYESPSVYALAILTALETGDHRLAADFYERMIELRVQNPYSKYYGGYVFDSDTHSFDNLLPLLAERKALNAKIVP